MFDLAESSQFEKDADLILLLYRPGKNTHIDENDATSELLDQNKTRVLRIAKNKEYLWGRWPLAFDGAHQKFTVLSREKDVMRQLIKTGKEVKERNRREAMKAQGFDELGKKDEKGIPF